MLPPKQAQTHPPPPPLHKICSHPHCLSSNSHLSAQGADPGENPPQPVNQTSPHRDKAPSSPSLDYFFRGLLTHRNTGSGNQILVLAQGAEPSGGGSHGVNLHLHQLHVVERQCDTDIHLTRLQASLEEASFEESELDFSLGISKE